MKKLFRAIPQSFYSRDLYRDAAYKWQGTGISLLAQFALIPTIALIILILAGMGGYQNLKAVILEQFPQVTVQKGELSIDKPVPYYITYENEKLVKIDNTEAANNLSLDHTLQMMKDEGIYVFVNKTKIITLQQNGETEVRDFSDSTEDVTFDKADVERWLSIAEIFGIPFIAVFMFVFYFIYLIVQMLLYSLAAIIFNKFIKADLKYSALQRITTCALFPWAVISVGLGMMHIDPPFILSFICTLVFILFGLKSVKNLNNNAA